MFAILRRCSCLKREPEDIKVLDFKHCGLADVPNEIFNFERTLEELYLDFNQIQDLPRPLFYCHELKKLGLSDNEIHSLPSAIASLVNLEELDVCKNAILDIPDNIKLCKCLRVLEASVNPLGKLPDGFTQLINLEVLYLNDTFIDYLPANFGRLFKLRILELRENHLKCLPKSMARLSELSRLDIGHNDFRELPEVVNSLPKLSELWCDCNRISAIPAGFGNLKNLTYLDASKNRIESIPIDIEGCSNLTDITLSSNNLKTLPESIACLKHLEILRLDDNRLQKLPNTIGSLANLEELVISQNNIQRLPPGIGLLRKLHTLLADENVIDELPPEIGSCVSLTILSFRCNRLVVVPDELGHNYQLQVINFSENRIRCLPYGLKKLKDLQALWLSENQNKPLIPLQGDIDMETGQRVLTCYLLPQASASQLDDYSSDVDSFQLSVWEEQRPHRQQIKFAYDEKLDKPGKLIRNPTPYPKELKSHAKHARNQALKSKGGANYVNINTLVAEGEIKSESSEPVVAEAFVSHTSEKVYIKEAKVTKPTYTSPETHDCLPLHVNTKEQQVKQNVEELAAVDAIELLLQKRCQVDDVDDKDTVTMKSSVDGSANSGETSSKVHNVSTDSGVQSMNKPVNTSSEILGLHRSEQMHRGRCFPTEVNPRVGYRNDNEVYENLRKDSVGNVILEDGHRRLRQSISDGYSSDVDLSQRTKSLPYNDQFMNPICSFNKMGKAASVSTAVAKKMLNDNNYSRPSLLTSHNQYFIHSNKFNRADELQDIEFNKSLNMYRLSHGPPPDLLPRNTGQMVIDGKSPVMYNSSGHQQMYPLPTNMSCIPHNPVPLPPRRRPNNLNLFPIPSPPPMSAHVYPPHVSPMVVPGFYLRPSPPSPYSVHGPPSPNRNRKPPPYHIATNYSKRAFIGPPSPVLKSSSIIFRPPSPSLNSSRLTPPPQTNLSSNQFRRSCHGSDPAIANRSNTPPSPSVNNVSFRQRSLSSVNGAVVLDNPYVEDSCSENPLLYHQDCSQTSFQSETEEIGVANRGKWSPQISRPRFMPNFNSGDIRRGSLSAPSTPPPQNAFAENTSPAQLPAYRIPPLYQSDSMVNMNGETGETSKFSPLRSLNVANGYHMSGPRWPTESEQEVQLDAVREPQCGIFTALPVLVKSCSGAEMNLEAADNNLNETSGSTVYANMYTSKGRLM
ncbi:leucine rich repeat containing [Chamberlinius hualienensis]